MSDVLDAPKTLTNTDLTTDALIDLAIEHGEGVRASNAALSVRTGARTGRSPNDRFIVKDNLTEQAVEWGKINKPFDATHYDALAKEAIDHVKRKEHFISHLQVGADDTHGVNVTVVTELAWHNAFTRNLFIRDGTADQSKPSWSILCAPNFKANPVRHHTNSETAIIINFARQEVLIVGTHYAGEMKKSMFSVLNFLLPMHDVLPMHCAANVGKAGDVALFFGLSGTGKTTLSADPDRHLIGDDEHGWNERGIFNFEGGCYAKCINLSEANEPVIWHAIRNGSVMENVMLDGDGTPDFTDDSLTQNTRVAYPRDFIPGHVEANRAGHPEAVLFLTCDLFGVLPPVSILTKEQAAYHFLSGYTALVGSTEMGTSKGIKPTFSTCFGAPFFPRAAAVYADLLMKQVNETNATVYLVNTGWTGGTYGTGKRFDIPTTRAVVHAILNDKVKSAETEVLPGFNLEIPKALEGIDSQLLNPRLTWKNSEDYDQQLAELAKLFKDNFEQFEVSDEVKNAGPQ